MSRDRKVTMAMFRAARRTTAIAAAAALLVAAAAAASQHGAPAGSQAVVLITIDTLRSDFVFGGPQQPRTPFLDRLAGGGVVFTNAHAPSSWTPPSMASLFTSLAPRSHGVVRGHVQAGVSKAVGQPILAPSLVTLAERLQRAGYLTIGVPANVHLAAGQGFDQGFDRYYGAAQFLPAPEVNRELGRQMQSAFGVDWKRAWKQRKTFLWLHYFDPHDPYFAQQPWIGQYAPDFAAKPGVFPAGIVMKELKRRYPAPDPTLASRLKALYQAEISFLDESLRRLDDEIGFAEEDVLLVLSSDHGEELAEHGGLGHGRTLYEEVLRIPLLIRWPARLGAGRRSDETATLLDVAPTLLDLLGLPLPPDAHGHSLATLTSDRGARVKGPSFYDLQLAPMDATAVRDEKWKLIVSRRGGVRTQLFDLDLDPGERNDVAAANAEQVRRLSWLLERWEKGLPPPPADLRTIEPDPQVKEQLRALGYVN